MGKGGEAAIQSKKARKISLEELSKHRIPSDAWLSYKGKVYDVSSWNDHPGGSVIFTHAGDDCTDIFAAFHPGSAAASLEKFEIGIVDESINPSAESRVQIKSQKQKDFEKGYRELRAKLVAAGMFNSSKLYYVYKVTSNLGLLAIAAYLAMAFDNFFLNMTGAIVMGLFWQQCGWLAHDFLHHQVFQTRLFGDCVGLLVGDLFQGFSVQWWKTKHNAHHAVPNLHASVPGACDGDPDIDTMPVLAWSLKMAEQAKHDPKGRFFVAWQAVTYFPLLCFARLAWAFQSWTFVFGGVGGNLVVEGAKLDQQRIQYPTAEKILLILHYAGLLYILSHMPVMYAVSYFLLAQTSCGLMLALVFGLGHNGMAVYPADQRPDFWKLQVTTTRNVTSNPFVDWFCGGLQYQVDHHLFPSLPRHNLKQVNKLVASFCKEQGVTYHEASMLEGTKEVLAHLSKVSADFIKEFPAM